MSKTEVPSILRWGERPTIHEFMVGHLANQFYCVPKSTKIRELSDELKRVGEIWALGVVDDGRAIGIIVTTQFQERMSRPFAHDVFDKKPVTEVMTKARSFCFDKNLLSVADDLSGEVQKTSNHYFLVHDHRDRFVGIFSTKDLLIHQFREHQDDVETAITIQRSVVPEELTLARDAFDLYAENHMAKGVGGDFVAVKDHGSTVLASVCDVSGKGIGASLVTATLGGLFANYQPALGLAAFVGQVNNAILEIFQMEKYLTGAFLEVDANTGRVLVADMGHAYVGLVRRGQVLKSPPLNPFVGFVADLAVQTTSWQLEPGDLVFLYTDGFPEQQNVDEQEFGVEAVEALLVELGHESLPRIAGALHHAAKKFRAEHPRGDDEAVLLLRYRGAAGQPREGV